MGESPISKGIRILRGEGLATVISKSVGYVYRQAVPDTIERWYSRRAYPLANDFSEYTNPPDPFKTLQVNPRDIELFSGRDYPPYHGSNARLGVVMGGEWDRREPVYIEPAYEPRYELYREDADCFSESTFFTAVEEHVVAGTAWEETEWFRRSVEYINSGASTSKGITDITSLERRCKEIDALFQTIEKSGYASQSELRNYPVAAHEVTVDIGRDGTFLFVNGRTRLSIAKILGIETIPVGVYVRHERWMQQRDDLLESNPTDRTALLHHPDIEDQVESR